MPKFVIEREIPGAGKLSAAELKAISQRSCSVLSSLGPQIQWVQSYVTGDKIYCVYNAPNEEMVRRHAKEGGFPANSVARWRRSSTRQRPSDSEGPHGPQVLFRTMARAGAASCPRTLSGSTTRS